MAPVGLLRSWVLTRATVPLCKSETGVRRFSRPRSSLSHNARWLSYSYPRIYYPRRSSFFLLYLTYIPFKELQIEKTVNIDGFFYLTWLLSWKFETRTFVNWNSKIHLNCWNCVLVVYVWKVYSWIHIKFNLLEYYFT